MGEIIKFLVRCAGNKPNWFMDNGSNHIAHITDEHGGDGVRARRSCTRTEILGLLHSCDESPVLLLGEVTPCGIMEYAVGCHHLWGWLGYLSKSTYGTICAADFHLFRIHNHVGFSEIFHKKLGNLFRGFFRQLTLFLQQVPVGEHLQTGGGDGTVVVNPATRGCRINKEGKDPMSVDLYKKLCGSLLDWNTNEGVFGHCFLVLTWNLSCRTENTANIQLCEINIEWESTFDVFEIYFAHTKMDQTGDEAKYSHHLYANPCCPLICPVLSLAFYFSCCCNLPQSGESRLFPGWDQYQRFSEMLTCLIRDHKAELSELGVNPKMIGMHSIKKGAVTYMSSLPGGPSISSVCFHAGWTMASVKYVYMCYLSSGDQFVGCSPTMLPLLQMEFASPPSFIPAWDDWRETYSAQQFPMFDDVPQFLHLKLKCLASMVNHCRFIVEQFNANHIVLASGQLFRDKEVLHLLDNNPNCVVVTYPWSSNGG